MLKKKQIFCADDWGFSPGVNEGILELAKNDLLHSVSCVANSKYLEHGLLDLLSYAQRGVKFNIHFNLTYDPPENISITSLLYKIKFDNLFKEQIANKFKKQLKVLRDLNIPIDGVDGHHHIHLLPGVYNCIRSELSLLGINRIRYMEDSEHLWTFIQGMYFKKIIFEEESKIQLEACGYLLSQNLLSKSSFYKKIQKYDFLIAHPAKYDDFTSAGMEDSLREKRVEELKSILGYFHE